MDRKGQTWSTKTSQVVFTVLRSRAPTSVRRYWLHEVVYLANRDHPEVEGRRAELEESTREGHLFDRYLRRVT